MNLLIDIGNSRMKWARQSPDDWQGGAIDIDQDSLAAELDSHWSSWERPEKLIVSSVAANNINQILRQWAQLHWAIEARFVTSPPEQFGLTNRYEDPAQLGCDRWLAMLAAMQIGTLPLCVIACGTAVTLDVINKDREFCGGLIFPGLHLLRQSLVTGTAAIGTIETKVDEAPALNTAEGAGSGTLLGLVGAIRFIMDTYEQKFGSNMVFMITGGDAELIQSRLQRDCIIEPDLTLKGLALLVQE